MGCLLHIRREEMKIAKWAFALMALMVFVGCGKSDEQTATDAATSAVEGAADAVQEAAQ
jgi:hypothetical protein